MTTSRRWAPGHKDQQNSGGGDGGGGGRECRNKRCIVQKLEKTPKLLFLSLIGVSVKSENYLV